LTLVDRHAEASVNLNAIEANVIAFTRRAGSAAVMAVVKADGYGHGAVPAARAALAGGASWLGVVQVAEALQLRDAGINAPVLCLMAIGADDHVAAIARGVDVSAGSAEMVRVLAAAAREAGRTARVHLKADTGLNRGGAPADDWPLVVDAALDAQRAGDLSLVGLWSHFASSDEPGNPSIAAQVAVFRDAVEQAEKAGVTPEVRHIANTAATIGVPEARFDLVRVGGGIYGLSTLPGGAPSWLTPAMTLRARLIQVKLGLVPLGYADGIPRAATNQPLVFARGRRRQIAGTVCMDQFVIDFGDDEAAVGDEVVLFGPGNDGEATAQEWGEKLGTISYEIVTGIGARVPRISDAGHI
jgi:alanine racemase